MLFQIKHQHSTPATGVIKAVGLLVSIELKADTFTDLTLKAKEFQIIARKDSDGYISIVIPTSTIDILSITERVLGEVSLKINKLGMQSETHILHNITKNIGDFRFDIGAKSASSTLILNGNFSQPFTQNITNPDYSSKKKLNNVTAGVERYIYAINPSDYEKYRIGADFNDGTINGEIIETNLTIGSSQTFTVAIEVIL